MAKETDIAASGAEAEALTFGEKVKRELREWAMTLAVFIPAFMVFSGLAYEQRVIPSESMIPNLEVSDRVAVSKFAYGYGRYSFPFSLGRYLPLGDGRFFASTPERGDVVVFEHTHTPRVMIKRVIGLPGDEIQVLDEQLFLNGEAVSKEFVRDVRYVPHDKPPAVNGHEWRETIGDKTWLTNWWNKGGRLDSTAIFVVPEGHLFLMGDNRDNSLDSRALSGHCPPDENGIVSEFGCELRVPADRASIGFVPMDNLIGRAETVLMSFHRCKLENDLTCKKRVWKGL